MKKLVIIIACISFNFVCSQSLSWCSAIGGTQDDYGVSLCLDPFGNSIVVGNYYGGLYTPTSYFPPFGITDMVIKKVSPSGQILWVKCYGSSSDDKFNAVASDSQGNIYAAGNRGRSINFDGETLTGSGYFLLKFSPNGTIIWRKKFLGGFVSYDKIQLAVDPNDDLIMTGVFQSTQSYGGFTLDPTQGKTFVLKINSAGQTLWAKQLSTTSVNKWTQSHVTVDSDSNIIITGFFEVQGKFGSLTFDIEDYTENAYLTKMDTNGNFLWTKTISGPESQGVDVVSDNLNNIYATGYFSGEANINNTVYNSPINETSIYLIKYNSLGVIQWTKIFDLNTPIGLYNEYSMGSLAVSNLNQLYFMSTFTGSINFGGNTYNSFPNTFNTIVANIEVETGNIVGASKIGYFRFDYTGASGASDKSSSMVAKNEGIYISSGNSYFNGINYANQGGSNVSIVKLNNEVLTSQSFDFKKTLLFYPNPANEKIYFNDEVKSVQIFSLDGKMITSVLENKTINISNLVKGVYLVQSTLKSNSLTTQKLIKN